MILDASRTTFVLHVSIAGSFVTEKVEPNDFDCLIATNSTPWDAELRPFEYNLVSIQAAKRRFKGDVISVVEGVSSSQGILGAVSIKSSGPTGRNRGGHAVTNRDKSREIISMSACDSPLAEPLHPAVASVPSIAVPSSIAGRQ